MAVGTAVMAIGGAILGGVAASKRNKAEQRDAAAQRAALDAEWNAQKNENIASARDDITGANNALTRGVGSFAVGTQSVADQNAQANISLAQQQAELRGQESALAAKVGASGVRNVGSVATLQEKIADNNAADLGAAKTALNSQVKAQGTEATLTLGGIRDARNLAVDAANRVITSYTEGGDRWNAYQADRQILSNRLADAKNSRGLSILTGALGGATSGLNFGSGMGNIFKNSTFWNGTAGGPTIADAAATPNYRRGRSVRD